MAPKLRGAWEGGLGAINWLISAGQDVNFLSVCTPAALQSVHAWIDSVMLSLIDAPNQRQQMRPCVRN
jgi:hypothetical protein